MDLFTIYSYGGSTTLFYIFNAIAMLFKSNFADQIFKIMTMFGLVWAGMRSSFNQDKIVPYAKWFLSYLTVMLVLIQPPAIFGENKVKLHIRDVVIPGKAYSVSNIPPGLILPATFISNLGYSVTKAFETVFTLADGNYLPYNEYGTMFGAQVMSELRNYKIQNPIFRENMESYVSNCMMYDVMIGKKYNVNELYNEKNILTLLTNHASNLRMFNYRYDKERKLVTCKEGIAALSKFFDDEVNLLGGKFSVLSSIGSKIPVRPGTPTSGTINNGFLRAFEAGLSFYGHKDSAAEQLKQTLIINAFKDIPASYGTLRAVQNQNTAWRYTGEMAQQVLPIMHALFQALIYASFPIVVCLVFFPNGFRSLGAYIGMMIWIELWAPLFAVLNLVVSVFAKAAGGVSAITIDNINNIASTQSSYAMAASSLGMLVPVLSYMIIKGGAGQLVHIASQMLGASTAGVATASQEVVSGNRTLDHVSIGDQSFHNVNANKYDTTGNIATGHMRRTLPSGLTQIELADGRVIFAGGGGASSSTGNLNITSSQRIAQNLSKGIQNEQSIVASQNEELTQSMQQREAQSVSFLAKISENETKGERYEFHGSVSDMEKMRHMINDTKVVKDRYGYTWDQAAKVSLGLDGKVGAQGGVFGNKVALAGNANASGAVSASSNNTQGLSEEGAIQSQLETDKALDVVSRISKDAHYSKSQTTEKDLSDQINVSHEKIKQKSESIAFHRANAARMQETLDVVQSKDFQVNQNNLDEFISFIAEKKDIVGSKIGKTKAATMIENIANNKDAQQYLIDFQKSRIPEQQMPSRLTMNDEQKKIHTQIKDAKIENTTQAFKDKIKQDHFGDHNTDGTELKNQYESRESEAKQKIEEQRMKTDKKGDVIKNKINKHENKTVKRVLNALGIGKANPYRNKNWKDG